MEREILVIKKIIYFLNNSIIKYGLIAAGNINLNREIKYLELLKVLSFRCIVLFFCKLKTVVKDHKVVPYIQHLVISNKNSFAISI